MTKKRPTTKKQARRRKKPQVKRAVPLPGLTLGEQFDTTFAAAQAGANWALAELYRTLHPKVLRYLRAQEPSEGEDLASDVWIEVATGLTRFEGNEQAFRAWVFVIARRRLIDFRRKADRRRTQPVPNETMAGLPAAADPEAEAVGAVATERALAMIATLPSGQAEVLMLRVVAGMGVEEASAVMGKRPGTVRVLQHRALKSLAKMIEAGRNESVTESDL